MGNDETNLRKIDRRIMPKVTVFLPISRDWRIQTMAEQLSRLDYAGIQTDIVAVIDNKDISEQQFRNAFAKYEVPGNIVAVHCTGNPGASEANVGRRRERIMNVWNQAAKLIPEDSELVFTVEDDTELPKAALKALVEDYQNLEANGAKVGLVSGIQVGRWGFKMIGAWRVDDPANLKVAETVPFTYTKILDKVDAAGFYCFITPRHLFVSAEYTFNQFGADVNYGLEARRKGFQNYIDWTIKTGHVMQHKTLYPDESVVVVKYELKDGEWVRTEPSKPQKGKLS